MARASGTLREEKEEEGNPQTAEKCFRIRQLLEMASSVHYILTPSQRRRRKLLCCVRYVFGGEKQLKKAI